MTELEEKPTPLKSVVVDQEGNSVPVGTRLTSLSGDPIYLRGHTDTMVHVSRDLEYPYLHCMSFFPSAYNLKIVWR